MNLRQSESNPESVKNCISIDTSYISLTCEALSHEISNQILNTKNRCISITTIGITNEFPNCSYSPESTKEILIEDIVIDFLSYGCQETSINLEWFGCKPSDIISVGFPIDKYNKINQLVYKKYPGCKSLCQSRLQGYVWVPCRILSTDISNRSGFFVHNRDKTTRIGTITDIAKRSKSNMIGHGIFYIYLINMDRDGRLYLHFFLKSFSAKAETNISGSIVENLNVVTEITLLENLKRLGIDVNNS